MRGLDRRPQVWLAAGPQTATLEMTGWLPHALRGYISRVAKGRGLDSALEYDKVDGVTWYRIKV